MFGGDSHGTHCAGTIAADSDNGLYVAGVAGGRGDQAGASLMTLTVFGLSKYAGFAESLVLATLCDDCVSARADEQQNIGTYVQHNIGTKETCCRRSGHVSSSVEQQRWVREALGGVAGAVVVR